MAIGDKKSLPLAVCNKVPDEDGNITLSVEDIAELEAALQHKADNTWGTVSTDLFKWATAQTASTSFLVFPNTPNAPVPDVWFGGTLFHTAPAERMLILRQDPGKTAWIIQTSNGTWNFADWQPIATATPPVEHDLPLAEGVMNIRKTYFIKEQNWRTRVHFVVTYQPAGSRTVVIGTLPASYHPTGVETNNCLITEAEGDVFGPGSVEVLDDGTVRVYANKVGSVGATGSIEFTATH